VENNGSPFLEMNFCGGGYILKFSNFNSLSAKTNKNDNRITVIGFDGKSMGESDTHKWSPMPVTGHDVIPILSPLSSSMALGDICTSTKP